MEERCPGVVHLIDEARDLLKELIEQRGVTITGLSLDLGWSRTYLHDLVGRRLDLKMVHVFAVLDALDLPAADFLEELARRCRALDSGE